MDRLKVLQGDPNLSNTSQGGYETAQDDSCVSIYYSMTEDSLTEDDADITAVASDEILSPNSTPLHSAVNKPNMIDAAGQLQKIPEILVTCPTDTLKLSEIEACFEINENCATLTEEQAEVAHSHSEMVDGVEELTITPIPQATAQICNESNEIFEKNPINSNVYTRMTDESTESGDDLLEIRNQEMIDLAAGHLSTIEEIDEICDLRPTYSSKPLEDMTNTINSTVGIEKKSQLISSDLLPNVHTCTKENTATVTKRAVKRSSRMSLSTQHRQSTIMNPARLLSSVAEVFPGNTKVPSNIKLFLSKFHSDKSSNIINVMAQNNPAVKTRQSLAPKVRSPFKRNGLRHSMNIEPASSQSAGPSKMALRRSTRLSIAHGKMATLKINPKSPSKIMVASPSRPIVKSPFKPSAVAAEAKAVAATVFKKSSYVCGVCSKVFLLMSNLTSHKRTHKPGTASSIMCKYCDKKFAFASALDTHLREKCTKIPSAQRRILAAYVPQRPVSSMPNYRASSSSSTPKSDSVRKMPHSGIFRTPSKVFRCHTCGQQFKDINSYTDHSDIHDEEA